MNRLIIDPVSHGVIVTDGGNKKIWAIGPEGEKKAVQFRPWRKRLSNRNAFLMIVLLFLLAWAAAFLTTDVLVILHAGCLTFHAVHQTKQVNNGPRLRNIITNAEKV
jgi:hypothetical protein